MPSKAQNNNTDCQSALLLCVCVRINHVQAWIRIKGKTLVGVNYKHTDIKKYHVNSNSHLARCYLSVGVALIQLSSK